MKKILIIYPHFPPSNLAGVHRPRLLAQHLPTFGWEPVVLTVDEKFYEEIPDHNLVKLLPAGLRIEKVKAYPLTKPRLAGDIGLRAFFQLYKKARLLVRQEHFDFILIPVPSFYTALLGRLLHAFTGIPYGIDYIDPWVHRFPGSDKLFNRHWLSSKLARWLEPVAVKKADLITGVAEGYYLPVLERNPHLKQSAVSGSMPYGGEIKDHQLVTTLALAPYLFQKSDLFQLVYAGAMLPKAYTLLEAVFRNISLHRESYLDTVFHFIGTGIPSQESVTRKLAEKYGLWKTVVVEHERIPYLDVLVHLKEASAVFVLGSTEKHYSPSKIYQAVLSEKPVLALLHQESPARSIIENSNAGQVFAINENTVDNLKDQFTNQYLAFREFAKRFSPLDVNRSVFAGYSAENVTRQFTQLLDKVFSKDD